MEVTRVHEYNQHISHDVQQQKHGASHANQHTGKSRNQGKRSILELCLDCVKYTLEADYLTTMANQTGVMSKNAGPKIKMNNAHVATATTTNNGRSKRLRTTGLSAEKITLVMNTCKEALVMKP